MPWEIFDKKASSASEKARYTKSAPIIKVLINITLKNPSQMPPLLMVRFLVRQKPLEFRSEPENSTTETTAEDLFRRYSQPRPE